MKFKIIPLLLFLIVFKSNGIYAQTSTDRIAFPVPTIQEETTSIWRTINDIQFLERQGYNIHLPKDPQIDSLIAKSKRGEFGNQDFSSIYNLVEEKFFDEANYKKAIEKVESKRKLINSLIASIDVQKDTWEWKFNMFDQYKIRFTLYGTGGSYDPDNGIITLFTNKQGNFMNYESPANTIIHEIVHMGIENSIVQKHNLPHGLKERIVDTIVYLLFSKDLSEYRIQNMGNPKIGKYLKTKKDIASLDKIVSNFNK